MAVFLQTAVSGAKPESYEILSTLCMALGLGETHTESKDTQQ